MASKIFNSPHLFAGSISCRVLKAEEKLSRFGNAAGWCCREGAWDCQIRQIRQSSCIPAGTGACLTGLCSEALGKKLLLILATSTLKVWAECCTEGHNRKWKLLYEITAQGPSQIMLFLRRRFCEGVLCFVNVEYTFLVPKLSPGERPALFQADWTR